MKHIYRKPLLPALVMTALCFAVCFMTLFSKSIADDTALVDALYRNTRLEFQILPGDQSGSVLQLDTHTGSKIKVVEQIPETCTLMWCDYSVREPELLVGAGEVYGTNNLSFLAEKLDIRIAYGKDYKAEKFIYTSGENTPCVMDEMLASQLGLSIGDSLTIAPTEDVSRDPEKAPSLGMILVGTYTCAEDRPGDNGLIVPEELFLAKPGLLYNSNMMYRCFYRDFYFRIDPAYNRSYDQIEKQVEQILDDPEEYTIYSNARSLEQMVRPIERRLAVQQMLVLPLGVLFALACGVLSVLLVMSFHTEVFLRFMWGEPRWKVFGAMVLSTAVVFFITAVFTVGLVRLLAGSAWLFRACSYLGAVMAFCAVCMAVALLRDCSKNLVRFYQSREG